MTEIDRRRFLSYMGAGVAAIPALSLLDACSSSSKSSAPPTSASLAPASLAPKAPASLGSVNLQLSWLKDQTFLGDYQADAKGYWTSRGLKVGLIAGGGSIDPLVPVVAGKAFTSAPSAASVASAIAKGADLTIFATDTQEQPSAMVSLASNPIKTPQDMVGKKIGVNETTTVPFGAFLASNNISLSSMTIIPYNYDPSILTSGSVDALYGYSYDEPVTLAQTGVKTYTLLFSNFNYNVMNNAWTVPTSVLHDSHQRSQLVALMAGIVQGWTDVINNPTGLIPGLLKTYCGSLSIAPSLGIATEQATAPLITGGGSLKSIYSLTPTLINDTIAGLARQNVKLTTSSFDTTVMDDVRASL